MRVVVNAEMVRNASFLMMIEKYKMPEELAKNLANEIEQIIKDNEDD